MFQSNLFCCLFYKAKALTDIFNVRSIRRLFLTAFLSGVILHSALAQSCGCDYTIPLTTTVLDRNTLSVVTVPKDKRVFCFQSGARTAPIVFRNFNGSTDGGVNAPYIFKNCTSQIVFNVDISQGYAVKFSDCENVRITGTGSIDPYGILINGGKMGLVMGDTTTHFEVDHIDIRNSGFAGLMAKTDNALAGVSGGNSNPAAFVMKDISIHDNHFTNTDSEGMYIGNTSWAYGNNQHNIDNLNIYNNVLEHTGAEAIQVGATYSGNCNIYANYIKDFGNKYQTFSPNQNNGIQLGGGFSGTCTRNFVYGDPANEFSQNGIVCQGIGNVYISNNILVNPKDYGIYVGSGTAESKSKPFYVLNNTIINPAHHGILIQETGSLTNKINAFVHNNIGSDIKTSYNLVKQSGSLITLTQSNNYSGTLASFNFEDAASNNYHLTSASTSVIDQGTSSVSPYGLTTDFDNILRSGQGTSFDAGAFEYFSDYVISTGTLSSAGICPGDNVNIPFTQNSVTWPSGTSYRAVLSEADGTFGLGSVIIGTTSTYTGYVASVIPSGIAHGANYKIRVEAYNTTTGFLRVGTQSSTVVLHPGALTFKQFDKVAIANASSYSIGSGDFTIEAMVKMDSVLLDNKTIEIVSSKAYGNTSDGYLFGYNYGTDKLAFSYYVSGVDYLVQSRILSLTSLRGDNLWHHVAVSRTGDLFTFYLDGHAVGTQTETKVLNVAPNTFNIGYDDATSNEKPSFIGTMDYVRFWNVSRSEDQIYNNKFIDRPLPLTGLIGLWNFNECYNDQVIIDESPLANNGVLGSTSSSESVDPLRAATTVSMNEFKGLYFNQVMDSNYDVVTVPNRSSFNFAGSFTIEAYINLRESAAQVSGSKPVIYDREPVNGIRFFVDDANHLGLTIGGQTVISDIAVKNGANVNYYYNKCYAVAVTATKSGSNYTVNFYLDGALIGASKLISGANALNSTADISIGRDASNSNPLVGYISELRIWRAARTATEISGSLTTVFPTTTTNLIGYYRFQESSGQTVIDLSASNNPGVLGVSIIAESTSDAVRSNIRCHENDRESVAPLVVLNDEALDIFAYPNPFSDNFELKIKAESEEELAEIMILDSKGILIKKLNEKYNGNSVQLGDQIPSGLYFIKVSVGDNVRIIKVVKE